MRYCTVSWAANVSRKICVLHVSSSSIVWFEKRFGFIWNYSLRFLLNGKVYDTHTFEPYMQMDFYRVYFLNADKTFIIIDPPTRLSLCLIGNRGDQGKPWRVTEFFYGNFKLWHASSRPALGVFIHIQSEKTLVIRKWK